MKSKCKEEYSDMYHGKVESLSRKNYRNMSNKKKKKKAQACVRRKRAREE